MNTYKQLRNFKPEELLLDDTETRIILKFIFKPTDHPAIDSLPMSDPLRVLAQGLLVEAIDATYAVGFIKALFEVTANPAAGARKVIKRFAQKASKLWFKHATVHDLMDVKVFQFVLDTLVRSFRTQLLTNYSAGATLIRQSGAFVSYQVPTHGLVKAWT